MLTELSKPAKLDINTPLNVQYCIPLWLRDEQIKQNIGKVSGRISGSEKREDPIAIVCYGPSLNQTWEEIRQFKYVISCSGSHKFLLERGIVPTWHVEVDPRAHKIELLGDPHSDVIYLPASTVHPTYIDHLQKQNVRVDLWHVFDNSEDALRTLPKGEWALMGGSSVGLRCITIARFFGFTDLHVFGMDGCEGESGKHAAAHPSQPKGHSEVEYQGKIYRTTASMLECAKQTWHELDQMPDVKAKFYGEGLVQEMSKHYVRKDPIKGHGIIAFSKPELISPEYKRLNAQLHLDNLAYGVGGGKHTKVVVQLAESLKTRSILDYGCGKGYLAKGIPFPIWEYDPAIPGKEEPPRPADLVVCTDVLEHIEPDKLAFVLDDLRRVVLKVGYFVIATGPSTKMLADGRNTHLIQAEADWWKKTLKKFFAVGRIIQAPGLLHIVVAKK